MDQNASLWRVPECAVAVASSPEVLDEIRLAAVEAFYAFPRGGAEIGGILLGAHDNGTVRIAARRALECEHAFGPSFTLSPKDLARLEALLAECGGGELKAVGWYHSHTRSEIFLSPQDLEIHRRYFNEPWQVALVVRPGSMMTRAGFFGRAADGALRTDASYHEFIISPLGARPMVRPAAAATTGCATAAAPAAAPQPELPAAPEPPRFTLAPPPRVRRFGRRAALMGAGAVCLATAAATRDRWLDALAIAQTAVSLNAWDQEGTLQVRWESRAGAVRRARAGALEVQDGTLHSLVTLTPERLKTGRISYERQSPRVELHLWLEQPNGSRVQESLTFVGKLPPPRPTPEQGEIERLRTDLIREKMLNEALERELKEIRAAQPGTKQPAP